MKKEEVKVGDKTYIVKEVLYKDVIAKTDEATVNGQTDKAKTGKLLMQLATGMTDEEYESMNFLTGMKIQKVFNKINGLGESENFPIPPTQPSEQN